MGATTLRVLSCFIGMHVVVATGCAGEVESSAIEQGLGSQAIRNIRGRVFVRVRKIESQDLTSYWESRKRDPLAEPPTTDDVDFAIMPVEEIAEMFRARVISSDGYEYLEETPPFELAARIKADEGKTAPLVPPGDKVVEAMLSASGTGIGGGRTPKVLVGTDDRSYNPTTGYTNSTQMWVQGCGCSSTLISRTTALSAAHCFMAKSSPYAACSPVGFVPAADTSRLPVYGTWSNFDIFMPVGWTVDHSWNYDMAAVVFVDALAPGDTLSWVGLMDTSPPSNELVYMVGYPGDKPVPQMWYKEGDVTSTQTHTRRHNLDIIPGDSGASLIYPKFTAPNQGSWSIGTQSTENISGGYNSVRRYNTSMWNFLDSVGAWD